MAEWDLGPGTGQDAPVGGYFGTLLNWAGALTSLGLIAGLSMWGYQLAVRDVSGVPVVQALEGPMRVAPDDPGGELAAHQGLAVNAVAAEGMTQAPADRMVLAPPPVALTTEDMPGADLARAVPAPGPADPANPAPRTDDPRTDVLALADVIAEGVEPLSAPIVAPTPAPPAAIIPASVPGVRLSPRPALRPDVDLTARAVAASVATSISASFGTIDTVAVDPASILPGTRLVQLGAFESESVALTEWDRIAERFADYLEGKGRIVQRAESGGKTFYRLRVVGFDDIAAARRFCAVLVAGGANCIPAVTR